MNIPETYNDLVRARRDLWAALGAVPDAVTRGGPADAGFSLATLLDSWRTVEADTLRSLGTLGAGALQRVVTDQPDGGGPEQRYTVDGILWHVMIHEMRHTAQIAVLLRTQDIKPPSLDLLFYLPTLETPVTGAECRTLSIKRSSTPCWTPGTATIGC